MVASKDRDDVASLRKQQSGGQTSDTRTKILAVNMESQNTVCDGCYPMTATCWRAGMMR